MQDNRTSGNPASNDNLFSVFPKRNVSNVVLDGATITIRRQFDTAIADGATATVTAGNNEVFLPFDEERYTLVRSDGSTESLSSDKFTFSTGSTQVTIDGLGADDGACILIATLRKSQLTAKTKINPIINSVILNKSTIQ